QAAPAEMVGAQAVGHGEIRHGESARGRYDAPRRRATLPSWTVLLGRGRLAMRLGQLLARACRAPALPVALGSALYLAMLGPWFFTSRSVADVGIIVGSAARMLQGQVPYRDFFLFIGP